MLALTASAVAVVNSLKAAHDLPDEAGVRIAASEGVPSEGGMEVELVPGPTAGDQVVDALGARIFLDQEAASYLDDKVLDARVDDHGGVHFTVGAQHGDDAAPRE